MQQMLDKTIVCTKQQEERDKKKKESPSHENGNRVRELRKQRMLRQT